MADDDNEDQGQQPQQPFSVASAVYNGLLQRGVKPEVAYGALGSLMGESGSKLNAASINRGDGRDGSDSIGFGQWNSSRAANLRNTAQSMGLGWNSGQAQVAHLFNELDGKYSNGSYAHVLKALQGGSSVADGNSIWTRSYEVPANVEAQVAARLQHGLNLVRGAQAGTLDLSKLGAMDPNSQNMQAPGTGALGANSMFGGDMGALFQLAGQQNPQDDTPTFGDRLTRLGASLAGITSPAQASALLSGIKQKHQQKKMTPAEQLIAALKLKKAVDESKQSPDTQIGQTEDKKGLIMQRPDGSSYVKPIEGIDQYKAPDEVADPKPQMFKQYSDAAGNAQSAASLAEKLRELKYKILTDPEMAKQFDGTAKLRSWIKNFEGSSDDMSQLQKEFAALSRGYVVALQRTLPARMSTDKGRQMELDSIMPQGADNDSVTSVQSIDRMLSNLKDGYHSQMGTAQSISAGFPDSKMVGYINDASGKRVKLNDHHEGIMKKWQDDDEAAVKAYPAFKEAHDIRAGIKKPKSRVDQILELQGAN